MARESNVIKHCVQIVDHLHTVIDHLSPDMSYDVTMKFARMNLARVNPDRTKARGAEYVVGLTGWAVELVRLALSAGREINRIRAAQGLSTIDLYQEAIRKDKEHGKNPTVKADDVPAEGTEVC